MTIPLLILVNVVMLLVFLLNFNHLPPEVPLFYSRAQGENQITWWWMIFLLPIFMNLLFVLNRYVSKKMFSHLPFVVSFIDVFNIGLIVIFTAIFLKILFLIT